MPKLYAYNEKVKNLAIKNTRYANFNDLGTGKTPVTLCAMNELHDWKDAVIIVPAYLVKHWMDEAERWVPDLVCTNLSAIFKQAKNSDAASGHALAVIFGNKHKRRIWIISYSMLRNRHKSAIIQHLHRNANIVVLDESLAIANPKAAITKLLTNPTAAKKAIQLFAPARRKYILCGRPMTEHEEQIFCQYKFINPSIFGVNYWEFRTKYFQPDFHGTKWSLSPSMSNVFYRKINECCTRYRREDVLPDLPGSQRIPYRIEPSRHEQSMLDALQSLWGIKLGEHAFTTDNKLALNMKEQQLTAGYLRVKLEPGEDFLSEVVEKHPDHHKYYWNDTEGIYFAYEKSTRLKMLLKIVAQIPKDAQYIIFCAYKPEIGLIEQHLFIEKDDCSYGCIAGGMHDNIKHEYLESFQAGLTRALVATTASLAKGHKLTQAQYLIYFTHCHSFDLRDQSEARPQRPDQVAKVGIVDIIMENTIDVQIHEAYKRKMDLDKYLTQ